MEGDRGRRDARGAASRDHANAAKAQAATSTPRADTNRHVVGPHSYCSSSNVKHYSPKDWEERVHALLGVRYGTGDYQRLPDEHGGDFGLEGFSSDGCAFQCYYPREPLSTKARYDAHRNKVTNDAKKFIKNKQELANLFGELKIRRWILIVPKHDSSKLLIHAAEKAAQIRAAELSYVADDFRIAVMTEADFERERRLLDGADRAEVHYPLPEVNEEAHAAWLESADAGLIDNLRRKAIKIQTLSTPEKVEGFEALIARNYIAGQEVLDELRRDHPRVYEAVILEKAAQAHALEAVSMISSAAPSDRLQSALKEFDIQISRRFPQISSETRSIIAMEAVADWLLLCPLDLPNSSERHE